MRFGAIAVATVVLFVVAASALWRTVGGLVEQAGAREERRVQVAVSFTLRDDRGQPVANAPVRIVLGGAPQDQPAAAGTVFTTGADGSARVTTAATIDQAARTRPTNFLDSLFAKAEPTDHIAFGVELDYLTYRWLYVGDLYRFMDGDVVFPDGLALFSRDTGGRFSRRAVAHDDGWEITDLGAMRLTTPGHALTGFQWQPAAGADEWQLSLTLRRDAPPTVR